MPFGIGRGKKDDEGNPPSEQQPEAPTVDETVSWPEKEGAQPPADPESAEQPPPVEESAEALGEPEPVAAAEAPAEEAVEQPEESRVAVVSEPGAPEED